ncbi:MAG: DUF2927 domain-containing protein [Rhodospirillales bacterium]|nr:MAG: DUF2927 domain-containing protein [Rhodospirillales bacterium]
MKHFASIISLAGALALGACGESKVAVYDASPSPGLITKLGLNPFATAKPDPEAERRALSLSNAVKAFEDSALRVNATPVTEVARWTGTIFLGVADDSTLRVHAAEIEAAVRAIAAIARVPVQRVSPGDGRRNFMVHPHASGHLDATSCRSRLDWDEGGRLLSVELLVSLDRPALISRCINHEAMHGFGFRGHPTSVVSVLSYTHANQSQPTEADRVLIETLYDKRLKPGMSPAAAAPIACRVIAEKLDSSPAETESVCGAREMVTVSSEGPFGHGRALR